MKQAIESKPIGNMGESIPESKLKKQRQIQANANKYNYNECRHKQMLANARHCKQMQTNASIYKQIQ